MTKKPFVTIITPTYNRADLIGFAIESIINQKKTILFDREMLIVDDGSTDNTKYVVEKYRKKYPKNIFYFYQKNSGIPGVARNVGLDHMNPKSDYTIFLDSDDELVEDCIYYSLKKFKEKEKQGEGKKFLGMYFLCKDENGNIIGNKKILQGKKEINFTYHFFLQGKINVEMGLITKSYIFLKNPRLRFDDESISEGIMWSKMRQHVYKYGMYVSLFDYVGRLYRVFHQSEIQITKTISPKRFKNNAIGNEKVLEIIGKDLLKFNYTSIYGDFLFRIGINWLLFGETKKGKKYLYESLKYQKSLRNLIVFLLSFVSIKIILKLYSLYIK